MQTKRLPIVLAIIAVIVAILLIVPSLIDWSKYQSLAQTKIKQATGYDLVINGGLRMALLPAPHATVKNVVIKKGNTDAFLAFDEASVRVALLPLLTGKIEIADVSLDKPVVNLTTYKDGTDNFTPVKQAVAAPAVDAVTGKPVVAQATDTQGQSISVNGLRIKDGTIAIHNQAANTTQNIGINDLHVKADTLTGPFDGDGDISYGNARFDISLSTGGYKDGESLPVQLNVQDKDKRASVKYSGVVVTGPHKEVQGEINAAASDLGGLLKDIGVHAAVPAFGNTQLSGMLTATQEHLTLTNGSFTLGKTKFDTKINADDMGESGKNIVVALNTNDVLDVDAMTKLAQDVKKSESQADDKKAAKETPVKTAAAPATLLPMGFTIPADLTADIRLGAPGLQYKGKKTGNFLGCITASKGVGGLSITLNTIPGGGDIKVDAATTATPGEVSGTATGTLQSLKTTLSDWLGVVDAKTFAQPGIPQSASLDSAFLVEGNAATLTIKSLSIGEPKINGMVSYTTGATPLLNAQLHATSWTMPATAADAKASPAKSADASASDKAAPVKLDININPPQLPFASKFDLSIDRLAKADLVISNVRVVGSYDGKNALDLTGATGTVSGGTLTAMGKVTDLKNLSGVDMQAGLKTSDLDGFVTAMTGKPLAIKQKIGAFAGALKAKGDRKSMAVAASVQALGFTADVTGTLDDPLSPELPGTLNFRVRHPDLAAAIRAFSPTAGSGAAGKPVDISGTAKINGKIYAVDGLKGQLGGSDIAGALKADLSGATPGITATITSNTLDVGSLVGVKNKTAKTGAAGTAGVSSPSSEPAGQWSKDPMDTGFLKAANLDITLSAGTLSYGTWTITNAKAGVNMKDGSLKVSPLSGGLYGGTLDGSLNAGAAGAGQPLNVAFKADVNNVAVGPFLQALMSSSEKRADGTGSVALDIKGAGVSSSQLVSSLAGTVTTKAKGLVIYGMDIDKLAANIVEAFDGGWKGVLTGFTSSGFSGGQTSFKDIDQTFTIAQGAMPVKDFKLETTNGNAIVLTNGTVSFAAWNMNLQSNVQVTQPKDVPVIGVSLSGPLDAPQKQVSSQALDNLVQTKLGGKVQDLIGKKLGNGAAGQLLNGILGGQSSNTTATPSASTITTTTAQPAKKQNAKQQLLQGVLNSLGR